MKRIVLGVALAFAATPGCAEDGGKGSVSIRVSGEGAARSGYPYVKNGAEIRFADDWTVRFSKYLVSVGELKLAAADDTPGFSDPDVYVTDLHLGDPVISTRTDLAARRWERLSFRVIPPPETAKTIGVVADADLARMKAEGLNYWIEGSAEKAGQTVSFAWGLANPTRGTNCTNGVDGTEGLVVRNNATTEAELTFHLDHLFWDTLGTELSKLRFDALAAAAGPDASVSLEDLRRQSLSDLRSADGSPLLDEKGQRLLYNPGSVPLPEQNLRAFVLATSAGQVHLNGLGLCTISRL